MTLNELPRDRSNDYRLQLPKLAGDEMLMQISWRWYDGPLSGIIAYRGHPYWIESRHDDEFEQRVDEDGEVWTDWFKSFVLVELTSEQHQKFVRRHEVFRTHVGTYNDYDEMGKPLSPALRVIHPKERWAGYFDSKWEEPPLGDNRAIGWFVWFWGSAEHD